MNERPHLLIEAPSDKQVRTYEGGGGGTYPRESYDRHARRIFGEAQGLVRWMENEAVGGSIPKRYFRLEVPEDQSVLGAAGAKFEEITHATLVGAPDRHTAHLSTTGPHLALLVEELERYASTRQNTGKSKFAPVEAIGPIPLAEKVSERAKALLNDPDANADVLLSLFPDLTRIEREAVKTAIGARLRESNGEVVDEYLAEAGLYVRVRARAKVISEVAQLFLAVQSVDCVERALELSAVAGEVLTSSMVVLPNRSAATVCIFDTGVCQGSRFLDGSTVAVEQPIGPPLDCEHGTFVASRIIFGDTLRDQLAAGQFDPAVKVLSVCVVSHDDIGNRRAATTEQLMRILRDTVERWHQQVRVYNLSINLLPIDPRVAASVTDDTVSPLAAEIDSLSRRYGVLFVVSAGNFPTHRALIPTEPYPVYFLKDETRIAPPAEAMLAITVGSLADRANMGTLAPANAPSPFTRRGPGFAGYRKPDLAAHGGNCGQQWQHVEDVATAGLNRDGDRIAYGTGTSYAAPLVSRLAAQLFAAVPNATPELVRALLVHFAQSLPSTEALSGETLIRLVGNGRPSAAQLLSSTPWAQTFIHVGRLGFREIRRVPFYVPKGLVSRPGRQKVTVCVTVVFSPETSRTLKRGYCKSHLRCKVEKLDTHGARHNVVPEDSPESMRDRYCPVIRFEKTFSSHVGPGDWQLLIEHESRWRLREEALPFAALISIVDPRTDQRVDIRNMIETEVPNRYTLELGVRWQVRQ